MAPPVKKKPAAKKPAVKKPAAKKPAAKKPAVTRPAVKKKTPAKKAAPKKKETTLPADPISDDNFDDDLWGSGWDDLDDFSQATEPPRSTEPADLFANAARDLIEAARHALDIAEELIDDPKAIGAAFDAVRSVASDVARGASRHVPFADGDSRAHDDDDDDFQFIPVDGD